ncbi:NAD(P)H-dependent oxidoreductase, partial [Eubacteriales bacterium OttesenSCG-928-N13]|nr:NAD(P)H-dependent oxidoreductase [Eubacteriales bacterium OttesenSCG-928-N13]
MKLLYIDACPRAEDVSRTSMLCRAFLDEYVNMHPDAQIEHVRLVDLGLLPFDGDMVLRREARKAEGRLDDPIFDMARQFADADRILIGAPYWDYSFPAMLKIYIDHISVGKILFDYTEDGQPFGLCKAERVCYVVTAGSPIDPGDWGAGYIEALFRELYGIKRFDQVRAEGIDIIGWDVEGILK